jgi:hypothetical protein
VESGRPAVLVAMSGTSAAFDSRGRRLAWVPPDQRGTFLVDVPLSQEETPYVRLGDWVPLMAGAITAGAALAVASRMLRKRSPPARYRASASPLPGNPRTHPTCLKGNQAGGDRGRAGAGSLRAPNPG